MKCMMKRSLALLVSLVLCFGLASGMAPRTEAATKKPTVANWGTRGQLATSLSDYAVSFYTGNYSYESLIAYEGSKYQSEVPNSDLYQILQTLMASRHTYQTNYDELRYDVYNYTDCEGGNVNSISCFYSGTAIGPDWDGGSTWNREHTWPQSKGSGKNTPAGADIMAVRPTSASANSSRGNTAYGESSGFYNPNTGTSYDLRGDCARIVLYTYVRWGTDTHIANMFGKSGVIENQNVLLKWMQEDPVDTWELGRNDSIQSYTGTRNVFVDYPELAFLLFGREVPSDMVTPSGEAKNSTTGGNTSGGNTSGGNTSGGNTGTTTPTTPVILTTQAEIVNAAFALGDAESLTGSYALTGEVREILNTHSDGTVTLTMEVLGKTIECYKLSGSGVRNLKAGDTVTVEGKLWNNRGTVEFNEAKLMGYVSGTTTPPATEPPVTEPPVTEPPVTEPGCQHANTEQKDAQEASCEASGYTGDTYCTDCGEKLASGEAIPAGHQLEKVAYKAPTETEQGNIEHYLCAVCGKRYADENAADRLLSNRVFLDPIGSPVAPEDPGEKNNITLVILAGAGGMLVVAAAVVLAVRKKKA